MFADIIKKLRKDAGLTQTQLAKRLDLQQTTVSCWETGKAKPTPEMLLQLAKLFDVSVDFLLDAPSSDENTTPQDLQFALFGTHEAIDDEVMDDVKAYAKFKLEQWKKRGR